jgi:flagellar motor switch protein FliM
MPNRQLRAQKIDEYFPPADRGGRAGESQASVPFDFRRPDRIPKSQLSAIHFLPEQFVRAVMSSLTVFLRSYVSGNLIGVEQLPYAEFVDSLPSPTCMVYMAMQPYDGYSVLEINPSLIAPILELVLGGNSKNNGRLDREITEVEESMMESVFRVIVHDLVETWKPMVPVSFAIDGIETKPQRSSRISRNEAVVAITMELHIADRVGMVNLVIPSITLKLMHQRSDQHGAVHKCGSHETEMAIRRRMSRELLLDADCELQGVRIRLRELQALKVGDVISLGIAADSPVTMTVAGKPKFKAAITPIGSRMAVTIESTEAG